MSILWLPRHWARASRDLKAARLSFGRFVAAIPAPLGIGTKVSGQPGSRYEPQAA